MCEWGDEENVWVLVAAEYSHTGKRRWKRVGIDKCISDIVRALSIGGMEMTASCCGHGKAPSEICLLDGRKLTVEVRRYDF